MHCFCRKTYYDKTINKNGPNCVTEMIHYAGVMTEVPAPEGSRMIQYPEGEYLIVKGQGKTADELNEKLTGIAFGQVLSEATNFAYVDMLLVNCGFPLSKSKS